MAGRMCPRCGKPYRGASCPRCAAKRKHGVRSKEQEAARKAENPWRSSYSSAEYKRNSQRALSATGGRCAVSGVQIADWDGKRWRMRPNGGIHHAVPLSQGGTNDVSNLIPLETSVHNRIDAGLRARRKEAE